MAARQLEELTLNVTDDKSVTSDDSFPDNIATMEGKNFSFFQVLT